MAKNWLRRRWFDFRNGHTIYLVFLLTFSNFVLIFHRLLVERVNFLNEIFSDLWFFIIMFALAYMPVAVLVGHWHKKTQLQVEQEMYTRQNPLFGRFMGALLDLQTGQAKKEEIEELRKLLSAIERGEGLTGGKKSTKK